MTVAHPEFVLAEIRRDKEAQKEFGKIAIPGFVAWTIGLLLVITLRTFIPLVLTVIGMLVILLGLFVGAFFYSNYVTRGTVANFQLPCRICDAPFATSRIAAHRKSAHPGDARLLLLSKAWLLTPVPAIVLFEALLAQFLPPLGSPDGVGVSGILSFSALILWLLLQVFWTFGVESRAIERLRAEWRELMRASPRQ